MKARVKKTGEIIDVIPELGGWCATDFKSYSHHYEDKELDFEFQNWEKFRREAAKDILAGLASWNLDHEINEDVQLAINYADVLIAKLKEK